MLAELRVHRRQRFRHEHVPVARGPERRAEPLQLRRARARVVSGGSAGANTLNAERSRRSATRIWCRYSGSSPSSMPRSFAWRWARLAQMTAVNASLTRHLGGERRRPRLDRRRRLAARQREAALRLGAVLDGERDVLQRARARDRRARAACPLFSSSSSSFTASLRLAARGSRRCRSLPRRSCRRPASSVRLLRLKSVLKTGRSCAAHLGRGENAARARRSRMRARSGCGPGDLGFDLRPLVQSALRRCRRPSPSAASAGLRGAPAAPRRAATGRATGVS